MEEFVSIETAATSTGITSRTIRYWVQAGKLPATSGKRGRLVRLGDVEALSALTGRAKPVPQVGETSAVATSADLSGNLSIALEQAMTNALVPLVERVAALERENGELRATVESMQGERNTAEATRASRMEFATVGFGIAAVFSAIGISFLGHGDRVLDFIGTTQLIVVVVLCLFLASAITRAGSKKSDKSHKATAAYTAR